MKPSFTKLEKILGIIISVLTFITEYILSILKF